MNRLIWVISGVIVLAIVSIAPVWTVVVVPEWPVKVVDKNGRSVAGVEIRQHWHHYSFDGSGIDSDYGGEQEFVSSPEGLIVFPARSFKASLLSIAFAFVGTPLRWINPHSSTGPTSYLVCLSVSCDYSTPTYRGNSDALVNTSVVVESDE